MALEEFGTASAVAVDAGMRYQHGRAELYLGDVLLGLREHDSARKAWAAAFDIWRTIGSADAQLAADRLRSQ